MTEAGPGRWAAEWTPTRYARNGAVEIAYDVLAGADGSAADSDGSADSGNPGGSADEGGSAGAGGSAGSGEPLLLVMGLAVSRFWWPVGFCRELAGQGFVVARYDQRDAGQSTRMPDSGGSNPFAALARKRSAYSSEDMTDDAIAVLDALGWERAHVFGASLGGIIAQRIALRHPDRVLSVVSAMAMPSDVSGIGGGRYVRFGLLAKLARAKFPEGREGDIRLSMMLAREVASPAYPFDESAAREWIEREIDSGPRDTKAQSRQVGAPWHGPKLRELRKPVLVLHGDKDPILRVSAARATARAIEGARLVILPGVGHDLPAPLWPTIAAEVRQVASQALPVA